MRLSKVKQAFKEFQRLQLVIDARGLEHKDNMQARVEPWEQVKILREQVDAYRQAGHELLSADKQQALNAIQCASVLSMPYVRGRSRIHSKSSAGSRSRDSSVCSQFDVVEIPVAQVDNTSVVSDNSLVVFDMSTTTHPKTTAGMSASASTSAAASVSSSMMSKADEIKKRWKLEEEMKEFERECQIKACRKKEALLDKAIADGMDLSALEFFSTPISSPDTSLRDD